MPLLAPRPPPSTPTTQNAPSSTALLHREPKPQDRTLTLSSPYNTYLTTFALGDSYPTPYTTSIPSSMSIQPSGVSTGVLVGIIVGCLLGLLLLVAVGYVYWLRAMQLRRRRRRRKRKKGGSAKGEGGAPPAGDPPPA